MLWRQLCECCSKGNVGIDILEETKLTGGFHTSYSASYSTSYRVWAKEAESHHRVRIVIFWQEEAGCQVGCTTNYGLNVVGFTIEVGWKRWFIVRAYVPPNDQPTVHQVEQSLVQEPEGVESLMFININTLLNQPYDWCKEYLVTAIAIHGLYDQTLHFAPWRSYRGEGVWLYRM